MGTEKHKKSHERKHSDDSDSDTSGNSGNTQLTQAYQQPSSVTDSLLCTGVSHQHKKSKKHKKEKDKKVLASICMHWGIEQLPQASLVTSAGPQDKHKKSKKDDKLLKEAKKFLKQSEMAPYAVDLLLQSTSLPQCASQSVTKS